MSTQRRSHEDWWYSAFPFGPTSYRDPPRSGTLEVHYVVRRGGEHEGGRHHEREAHDRGPGGGDPGAPFIRNRRLLFVKLNFRVRAQQGVELQ